MDAKVCTRCKISKPFSEYRKDKTHKDGLCSLCKICSKESQRIYESQPHVIAHRKDFDRKRYHKRNIEARHKKYGVTEEQFQEMLKTQLNKCAICLKDAIGKNANVDHCHKTGKVRGILCKKCNIALGLFRDDKYILDNAIKYLKKL